MSNLLKQVNKLQEMLLAVLVDFGNVERKLHNQEIAINGIVNYINEREQLYTHNMHLIVQALKGIDVEVNLLVPMVKEPANEEIVKETEAAPQPTAENTACDTEHQKEQL